MSNFQLNVKINGAEQSVKTIGEVESALKATKEELKGVEVGSEAFEELAKQARLLQDELKGSFKEATNFDVSLGKLTESVTRLGSSVAAGFAITTTAFQIFGKETEELSQAQVKAQQALTIAFSATTLATNAAKLAGDVKLVTDRLQLGITNLLTGAIGKETVAKASAAVATGTATVAQRALNAAMMANPILLLVGALGLLVGALVAFSSDTEKATEVKRDFNEELDRSAKLIDAEIKKQRDLERLRGRIREAEAKTEAERLRIRRETQTTLDELDEQAIQKQIENNEKRLREEIKFNELSIGFARANLERASELQDFNVDKFVTAEERRKVAIQDSFRAGRISIEEYIQQLGLLNDVNDKNIDEETIAQRKRVRDIIDQNKILTGQLQVANQTRVDNQKLSDLEIERAERESFRKRVDQTNAFKQDQLSAIQKRNDEIKKVERELQDFLVGRISEGLVDFNKDLEGNIELITKSAETFALVNTEAGKVLKTVEELTDAERENARVITVNNDDIIKGFDERIAQLEILRQRQTDDAEENFKREIETFRKQEEARKDANGKRVVSDSQINAAIAAQTEKFNTEQELRAQNFSIKIEAIVQQRADKIAEIEEILQQEIAFGDNSTNDNRSRLILESIEDEIRFSQRRIDNERRVNLDLIRERQASEAKKREFLEKSLIEEEQIQLTLALKSVQGTEEQKARQREELVKASNQRIARINDEFRSQEASAEIQNQREILDAQLARVNEYANAIFSVLNQIVALASAIEEGNRIALQNQLNDIRDSYQEQENVVTEAYNAELAALNERYQSGQLSQEQYNESVKGLNEKLAEDTIELENEKREIELDLKEKAFNDEKKLKIASAIIAGLQGALQAFTTAFQLGPIAGPIVGGILSALVATTTAVQVANIKKTKFDRGAPQATPKLGTVSGGSSGANAIQNLASGGGLTQFSPDLVNPGGGSGGSGGADTSDRGFSQRVYVLESDITRTQNRVSVAESSATFG
jgi:hypothetical protein